MPRFTDHPAWKEFRPKLIGLAIANVLLWTAIKTFYAMPSDFGKVFSAFTLVFLVFFLLSDLKVTSAPTRGGRFLRFLFFYVIVGGGIITGVIWGVMARIGFPPMFILTAVVYALLCLALFFVLEFKPPARDPKGLRAVNNLVFLYLIMASGYYFVARSLPQFDPANEIASLMQGEVKLAGLDKDTVIKIGQRLFKENECTNCHNVVSGADPKRGPTLNEIDLGNHDHIKESIVDPYKEVKKPYSDDPKLAKAMPDYYGKQMTTDEIEAVTVYLENLKALSAVAVSADKMPDGWYTDPKVLAEGKRIYEGLANENVACHVCHGKEGVPQLEGAVDFRSSTLYFNSTAARLFQVVKFGFAKDSVMVGWKDYLTDEQIWQVLAYENTFRNGGNAAERPEPQGPEAIGPVKEKYW